MNVTVVGMVSNKIPATELVLVFGSLEMIVSKVETISCNVPLISPIFMSTKSSVRLELVVKFTIGNNVVLKISFTCKLSSS